MSWRLLLALAPLIVACGSSTPTGPTLAQLEEARAKVHGFQPWDAAETTLKELLGEPKVVDETTWTWTGREGDGCHTLTVTRMARTVGTVTLEESACP